MSRFRLNHARTSENPSGCAVSSVWNGGGVPPPVTANGSKLYGWPSEPVLVSWPGRPTSDARRNAPGPSDSILTSHDEFVQVVSESAVAAALFALARKRVSWRFFFGYHLGLPMA